LKLPFAEFTPGPKYDPVPDADGAGKPPDKVNAGAPEQTELKDANDAVTPNVICRTKVSEVQPSAEVETKRIVFGPCVG
jgi:hypothetical protein